MVFSKLFEEKKTKQNRPSLENGDRKRKKRPRKRPPKRKEHGEAIPSSARQQQLSQTSTKRPRNGPPSAQTLELSSQLKQLSRDKQMHQALKVYFNAPASVRDAHHACILVDCCARCGDIQQAQAIYKALSSPTNIQTMTALLKGYAHAGRMMEATHLFEEALQQHPPNVRTLNTFLRGCLWSAAFVEKGKAVGGVVSSEHAWRLYRDASRTEATVRNCLDASSYEYSTILLCQALRTDEALTRVQEFLSVSNIRIKGKAGVRGGTQEALETLAVMYLGLSRSFALLGNHNEMWRACQICLNAVKASRTLLENSTQQDASQSGNAAHDKKKSPTFGGKRGWKPDCSNTDSDGRSFSNTGYRKHRLMEIESEARCLLKQRGTERISHKHMARRMRRLLLSFSGGGSTETSQSAPTGASYCGDEDPMKDCLQTARLSYGLSAFETEVDSAQPVNTRNKTVFSDQGRIRFSKVFKNKHPVDIEIGSGFGTWVAYQAQFFPARNHVAVELRADRVGQIFSRASLDPLENVCVIGSDADHLFRELIKEGSVATVFSNHPEPPTQRYGANKGALDRIASGGDEPAHMLSSRAISAISKCLQPGGRIVIVSDNHSYSQLLAATFAKAMKNETCRLESVSPNELGLKRVERCYNKIDLYEGQPNSLMGHAVGKTNDSSYFDRLFSANGIRVRYILVLKRP